MTNDRAAVTILGACVDCPRMLVSWMDWQALGKAERKRLAREGIGRSKARGLCAACYQRRRRAGTVHELPRATTPWADTLEEVDFIADELPVGGSETARAHAAAARLGVPAAGVRKALQARRTGRRVSA